MSVGCIPIMPLEAGEKSLAGKTFLHIRSSTARPLSAISLDTEFEYDSDHEDEASQGSSESGDSNRKSGTTLSSYDEAPTPGSNRSIRSNRNHRPDDILIKSIEGPRGPHLFRGSQSSAELEFALQMSPLLPKEAPRRATTAFTESTVTPTNRHRRDDASIAAALAPLQLQSNDADNRIRAWTSEQVVDWMETCGMDASLIESFEANDINGQVLLDLQFEHLRDQLDIQSFGKRYQLWSAICNLRGVQNVFSPQPTPFQDISRACTVSPRQMSRSRSTRAEGDATPISPSGGKKRRGRKAPKGDEILVPAESVSIVAIEQLMPKLHKCNKGERCAKWRKQQRELAQLEKENGIGRFPISPTKGGRIFITGDPGNATTADNIVPNVHKQQPTVPAGHGTDTLQSLAASSDVLGPGQLPEFALHESVLGQLGNRDPQDNVRQFLSLQHMHSTSEAPPSPPPELTEAAAAAEPMPRASSVPPMFPADHHAAYPSLVPPRDFRTPGPMDNLKKLPKLDIPSSASAAPHTTCHTAPVTAVTMDHNTVVSPAMVYRLGTPQSEMDVPVTAIPTGPVARDNSQSVPPNMQFRHQSPVARMRPSVTDLRRPSMPLPAVKEGEVLFSPSDESLKERQSSFSSSNSSKPTLNRSVSTHDPSRDNKVVKQFGYGEDCTHAGYMKKRKTKLLRHEWQDAHFRLVGSELSMHENARPASAAKEKINVEDYGVSCSSNASSNKLSAAMKAFRNKNNSSAEAAKADATAFNFQLVPSKEGDRKAAASGKTHHFAVKSKDERIDWMRELMLSKARKQKGHGYDVEVNGEKF